jgi:(2Fe-2S) ferredoxin
MQLVLACRGCCCGTSKHPSTDHDAQLDALRSDARVEVTGCLGPCRQSNVLAVVDVEARTQTWFAGVLTAADTAAVRSWLAGDGPLPEHLVFDADPADRDRARFRAVMRR